MKRLKSANCKTRSVPYPGSRYSIGNVGMFYELALNQSGIGAFAARTPAEPIEIRYTVAEE